MPMTAPEIETLLRETFPDAEITVQGDDGVHMAAHIVAKNSSAKTASHNSAWFTQRSKAKWMAHQANCTHLP